MPKFIAFAVDISGAALARYDLAATEKESAGREARRYLEKHNVIEVCPAAIDASLGSSESRRGEAFEKLLFFARCVTLGGSEIRFTGPALDHCSRWRVNHAVIGANNSVPPV
jgi:hypothetical protein